MSENEKKVPENANSEGKKFSFSAWWKKLATGAKAGLIAAAALVVIVPIVLVIVLGGGNDNVDEPDNGGNPGSTETQDTKVTYVVNVVDENGTGVKDVRIEFIMEEMPLVYKTDENGKSSFTTKKEVTGVAIKSIPNGYESDKVGKALSFDGENSIKITLKKLPDFVIKVVDNEGNLVEGVQVQMCDEEGSCRMPKTTGADGVATYGYEAGSFHAQLTVVPEGYTVEDASAYYEFVDGVATIVLTKAAE